MNHHVRPQLQNWIAGDESGSEMLKRVWRVRPFVLPKPLHRVPLRVGNVLELVGPSPSAKTQILIQTAITCILPKDWNGINYAGFEHLVLFIDLDSRFDIQRFSQMLILRIMEPYGNDFRFVFLWLIWVCVCYCVLLWLFIDFFFLSVMEQGKVVESMIKSYMICVCLVFCMFDVPTVFSFFRLSR